VRGVIPLTSCDAPRKFREILQRTAPSEDNPAMIFMRFRRLGATTALALLALVVFAVVAAPAFAQAPAAAPTVAAPAAPAHTGGGEANLKIPPLDQVKLLGMNGRSLLMWGSSSACSVSSSVS
jgi:hypothetical protein